MVIFTDILIKTVKKEKIAMFSYKKVRKFPVFY